MEVLRFLEGIRTPAGERFFSLVTHLGEETVFIVIGLLFLWCLDKKKGYYLLAVGFLGTVMNQFLKLLFRIPRPWIKDPGFTIVESARPEATGYSFPSGHTQTAVGVFGGIARCYKNLLLRILCVLACLLVPLSRMYLGVHTPMDVGVSMVIGTVLVLGLYPVVEKCVQEPKKMNIFLAVMTGLALLFLVFVSVFPFSADMDPANYESGVKNAYKILGCILGLWAGYGLDEKFLWFDTKAVWWGQLLKLTIGLALALAIKSGLKEPLYSLLKNNMAADGIRYFLLTAFASGIWPMCFRFLPRR